MAVPIRNFVGELQEMCSAAHTTLPEYQEESGGDTFKMTCKLKDWICHGTGSSKKFAKQNAAKEMLEKIETGKLLSGTLEQSKRNDQKSSVSKLFEYCTREKKNSPLFAELSKENDLFCFNCTLDDFSAVGKGRSKSEAKEMAAFKVAENFGVHKYYDDLMKSKQRMVTNISPVNKLFEFCQKKGLTAPLFEEVEVRENNVLKYKVCCSVGDLKVDSGLAHSKKSAKFEAATLLFHALSNCTPLPSPAKENADKQKPLLKRKLSSDAEETLEPVDNLMRKRLLSMPDSSDSED